MATANWRAYVATPGARVYPVITITLASGQQLHYSEVPFAYFKADLLRIGEVEQSFDETGGSIPLPSMDFVHGNAGREFERILEGAEEVRGAIIQKAYASPDLDQADWPVEFTGIIATWNYGPEGITVTCRHDDGPIRNSSIPALPIIKAEWGKVDLGYGSLVVPDGVDGLYIPLVYGNHDSTGLGGGGLVPAICVGYNNGTAEYLIGLGWYPDLGTNLTVYDLNKQVMAVSYAGPAYRGGKNVSVFGFSYLAPISADAMFRVDVQGFEPVGDGSGACITNMVAQLRHFLNLVYSGYRTGNYSTTAAPLNAASWNAAEAQATADGLVGAAYIGGSQSTERAKDICERWIRSAPSYRLWWNATGQLEILIFDPTIWPGYPTGSSRRLSADSQVVKDTLRVEMDETRVVRRVSSTLRPNTADGQDAVSVDVVDMLQTEQSSQQQRMDWLNAPGVDTTRQIISRQLRVLRRPTRSYVFTAPFDYEDLRPGDTIYLDGMIMPSPDGAGASRRVWSARALLVKSVSKRPTAKSVEIRALDAREMQVSFWTPGCTDLGASDEDNGLAMIHQGTAPACVRNQIGFRRRPGDQSFRDSSVNVWRLSPWGLSVCGGSGAAANGVLTWQPANNSFSQGTPPVYTGWSTTGVIFTGLADGEYLIDAAGYRQSAWPQSTATLYITSPVAVTNGRLIRVYIAWADFVGQPKLRLEDTAAGKWWNFAGGAWDADASWYAPTEVGANGSFKLHDWHYEFWSEEILVDAHANPTLRLHVGNNVGAGATAYIIGAAGFVVPDTSAGPGARPIRRDLLATTSAALAQAADIISIDNPPASPILTPDKGTLQMAVLPYWQIEDLDVGQVKQLWHLVTDSGFAGGAAALGAEIEKVDAATLRVNFYAEQGGSALAVATVLGAVASFMGEPIALGFRWTGADREYDLDPYTLDVFLVFFGATKGTAAVCSSTPAVLTAGSKLYLGSRGTGTPAYEFADAAISHIETRLFPLSDAEIERALTSLTLPARPVDG